jgi:hypothetical protein
MINPASSNAAVKIISTHAFAEVVQHSITNQFSLHAVVAFNKGQLICSFSAGHIFNSPNYLTIQSGSNQHITLVPEFLQYCNHSCYPNIFFDIDKMQIIALKDIEPNEELCFFYPSTELDMAQPFVCFCGSKDCLQNIKGAKYLPVHVLAKYRLTHFIQQQLKNTL